MVVDWFLKMVYSRFLRVKGRDILLFDCYLKVI